MENVYIRPQVTTHFSCKQTAGPSVWLLDHQRASLTDSKLHEKQSGKGKEHLPLFSSFYTDFCTDRCTEQSRETQMPLQLYQGPSVINTSVC